MSTPSQNCGLADFSRLIVESLYNGDNINDREKSNEAGATYGDLGAVDVERELAEDLVFGLSLVIRGKRQ